MASILDVIKGLNQAANNAYDGYDNVDEEIGLKRANLNCPFGKSAMQNPHNRNELNQKGYLRLLLILRRRKSRNATIRWECRSSSGYTR